jgi:hypothetical protein
MRGGDRSVVSQTRAASIGFVAGAIGWRASCEDPSACDDLKGDRQPPPGKRRRSMTPRRWTGKRGTKGMDGNEPLLKPPKAKRDRRPRRASTAVPGEPLTRVDCLNLLLLAFCDLADRDDIHEADRRLKLIRRWIHGEARRAAADAIFAEPSPAAQRRPAGAGQRRPTTRDQSGPDQWPIP